MADVFQWLMEAMPSLKAGEKVEAPYSLADFLQSGFQPTMMAEPFHGQSADFEYRLSVGRLHAQVIDGKMIVHFDRFDPKSGIANAVLHFVNESSTAGVLKTLGVLGGAAAVPYGIKRLSISLGKKGRGK